MNTWSLLFLAWGLAALVQLLAWRWQQTSKNAGIVDVAWSFLLGAAALLVALLAEGWAPRRALVGALGLGWALRLGFHLLARFRAEAEDGRYLQLRQDKGAGIDRWLFVFFQIQAFSVAFLTLAFAVPAQSQVAHWRLVDGLAMLVWLTAVIGEGIADRQLARWRSDPAHRGQTCRAGLWRTSRHPNYFFEWIHWFTYALFALGATHAWLAWIPPFALLFLILRVTGIPPTEARALASRGDDYRRYQRTTNAFFPGPPRPDPEREENRSTPLHGEVHP